MSDVKAEAQGPLRIAILGDPNSVHTRRWAAYFAGLGHEMHLLVPEKDPLTAPADPRFEVHAFPAWTRSRIRGANTIATSRELGRLLDRIRPDVLHAHSVTRYGLAAWESRFRPYAITVWGSDVLVTPKTNRRIRLQSWISLRGAETVTCGSEYLVKAAIESGARPNHTHYVHFGVDTDRFSPGAVPADFRARIAPPGRQVVLSPRAIAPIYRQDVVVDAFARLPGDPLLVMTLHGAREPELTAIKERAEARGVAGRLVLQPPVSEAELPLLYRAADVVVSVPVSDGGPNTVVEALSSGVPVVASDLPPNAEWLAALDPATLVPVGDVEATAAAILAVLERPAEERAERAARGREAVVARADRRASMAGMEKLYRQLAARHRRG